MTSVAATRMRFLAMTSHANTRNLTTAECAWYSVEENIHSGIATLEKKFTHPKAFSGMR